MADRIELMGLELYGYHGVFADEKTQGQKFIVDLVVWTDFSHAAASDDVEKTISYVDLADIAASEVCCDNNHACDLIETLASIIADKIVSLDGVHAVEVTVHKPYAPIAYPFEDVRVVARRSATTRQSQRSQGKQIRQCYAPGELTAIASLGSNMPGEYDSPAEQLDAALERLAWHPGIELIECSPFFSTPAWGGVVQDDFVNCVVELRTHMTPLALLHHCQFVEALGQRRREQTWGPRTIDVDIIACYDAHKNEIMSHNCWADELILPHKHAKNRGFVLVPWSHLASSLQSWSTLYGQPISDHIALLDDSARQEIVRMRR